MDTERVAPNGELFTEDQIRKQVDRILEHPLFKVSKVFQKFLKFIIDETLAGRANQIKEYTIAKYVLNKPKDFSGLHDGVVRVHACRLREALNKYYGDRAIENECEISIPKGTYIPVFKPYKPLGPVARAVVIKRWTGLPNESIAIAVMPLKTFGRCLSRLAFTDHIGQLMSSQFSHLPKSTVLSYYTTQHLQLEKRSIKSMASEYGINYVLAGNIQFETSRLRASIQCIDAATEILIWSDDYTYAFTKTNLFEIEDLIVARVMDSMAEFNDQFSIREQKKSAALDFEKPIEMDVIPIRGIHRSKKFASM